MSKVNYRPHCGDWARCPLCDKFYCTKYDRTCTEELCGHCYRNRDKTEKVTN